MDTILQVENLTKNYPGFKLDNISFSVPKGSIMGLIGENGAGKSTVIKAVLDIIKKDGGIVKLWGRELSEAKELKEKIGVVFDEINFYETLTPIQIGKIMGASYRQWDSELYGKYITRFSLPERKAIKSFSKGMKMKLGIAAALSHHPNLLILDEATSGLDPVMRNEILDIFLDFVQDEEHAVLMSSHITTDLEKVADYITFINEGRLKFCRSKDELRYEYGMIRCGETQFREIDREDMVAYKKDDYQYNVLVEDKKTAGRKYRDMIMDNPTIDDIMLMYVKGEVIK